ncbi:MAG: hypothetical protein ACOX2A_02810 [Tepidanaerobacteraceae bacterium]
MNTFSYHFKRNIIIIFAILHLANYFIKSNFLFYICCGLITYIFVSAVRVLPKVTRRISLALMLMGIGLMVWKGMPFDAWLLCIDKNGNLVTLFILVPIMFLPFSYDDYQKELKHVAQAHMQNLLPFCVLTFAVVHIFGVVISVGAVTLVYELFRNNAKLYNAEKTFMASLLRGYCSSGYWSPAWASILVVTTQMNIPWIQFIPWGVGFFLIALALDTIAVWFKIRQNPDKYPRLKTDEHVKVDWKQIYILIGLSSSLILIMALLSQITPWDLMVIIPLVSIVFPIAVALLQNKLPNYKLGIKEYYDKSVLKVMSQVALFTAAGFLSKALEYSGVGAMIPNLLPIWMSQYPVLLIGSIMLLMIVPSLVGLHPVAIGTALVATIVPASIGLTDMGFALTIIVGWALAILISPFSATSLIAGGLCDCSPWEISLGLNGKFGFFNVIFFSILIALINGLF